MRNLCNECQACPYRTGNSINKCFHQCSYPSDILAKIEKLRNKDATNTISLSDIASLQLIGLCKSIVEEHDKGR
jgi:hypothetical protein